MSMLLGNNQGVVNIGQYALKHLTPAYLHT